MKLIVPLFYFQLSQNHREATLSWWIGRGEDFTVKEQVCLNCCRLSRMTNENAEGNGGLRGNLSQLSEDRDSAIFTETYLSSKEKRQGKTEKIMDIFKVYFCEKYFKYKQTQSPLIIHVGTFVLVSTLKRKESNACESVRLRAFKTGKPVLFLAQIEHNKQKSNTDHMIISISCC